MTDLNNRDLARIRQEGTDEVLDEMVGKQLEILEVAGKIYRFKAEPRCRVCSDETIRKSVNKMLACGMSMADTLEGIAAINAARPKNRRITLRSLYTHRRKHFPFDDAAQHVWRSILEQEASAHNQDFVTGTGSMINVFSFLKTVEAKGYATLIDPATKVPPELGMNASMKLHELTKQDADVQAVAALYQKFNLLVSAVKDTVPPELWGQVLAKLEGTEENQILDVEVEDDEDEEFDPTFDVDDTMTSEDDSGAH